ncbi:hypothetical protein AAVH_24770 [Aphelenchoides avenae]|nr:hypothetical protein AAVH_24770 [Aphelenchus avenae]
MSYPDDCWRPEGITLTRAVARVYNPKLFSHTSCGCFHIYRMNYSGSPFTTREFHEEVLSIATKVRLAEQLRFDCTAFPEHGGMLAILKAFTEVNMLEINWKRGLMPYTPSREGVDDDFLRTCVQKKLACVYDDSGLTSSIVSEDALMNFCFSGTEVLGKAPNVTHARLMHGRRCLFLHMIALSPQFVKLFVQSFQTRENVDIPLCIRITTVEAPAFDLEGFTPRSNGLETEVTIENQLEIRFGESFGTSHHQTTITTV